MTCALFTSLLLTVESKQSYMAMWSGDVKCIPLSEYTSDILVYIIDMVSVIYTTQIKFYFTNSFIALSHIDVNINPVTYILEKIVFSGQAVFLWLLLLPLVLSHQ